MVQRLIWIAMCLPMSKTKPLFPTKSRMSGTLLRMVMALYLLKIFVGFTQVNHIAGANYMRLNAQQHKLQSDKLLSNVTEEQEENGSCMHGPLRFGIPDSMIDELAWVCCF